MNGTSKTQQANTNMTATAANKKKVPAHKKAIEDANSLAANPATNKPNNSNVTNQPKVKPIPIPKVKIGSVADSKGSNNASVENSTSNTDDYETGKVLTSRKSSIDEDVDAVKDLDKWNY
jgi:hypothetical protein